MRAYNSDVPYFINIVLQNQQRLEPVRHLHTRIVAEAEMLRTIERITRIDALRTERVECLNHEILHGYITRADGETADAVEVAVRQGLRPIAAEERTVLETLVVDEGVPTARGDLCLHCQ